MALRRIQDKLPDVFVMGLVVLLTGCIGSAEPRPVAVALDSSDVAIRLSDNSQCTGPVSAGRAPNGQLTVSGAGTLSECAAPLRYQVTADVGTNPFRPFLEEVFAAVGLSDAIAPAALVELTAPDGRRWIFASPPELESD